jgi:hypothetical protein
MRPSGLVLPDRFLRGSPPGRDGREDKVRAWQPIPPHPFRPFEAKGSLDRLLDTIERVGNKVPHPAIIFFYLIGIVIALSAIFGVLGTTVTYDGYDYATGTIVEQTSSVRSLLAPDGIRFMVTSPVANFLGFTGVGVILVAMIGVGLAEESGLIATLVRKLVAIAPASIFTFMIVMVGVVSSIAADAGYLVLVPWPPPPSTASAATRSPASPRASAAWRPSSSSTSSSRPPTRSSSRSPTTRSAP